MNHCVRAIWPRQQRTQVGWLVRPLLRASDGLNRAFALGPENAGGRPEDAPACRAAPEALQPAAEWAVGLCRSAGLRVNLRPIAEYQSVFLLAVLYLFRRLVVALLLWPPAVALAVAAFAGARAYRAVWQRAQRRLAGAWLVLESWWKAFEALVA